ncbi:hypothetical protein EK21DRAFT_93548 [Setomelanomma holmii]|uniref:Rhodopsin domain-containing protein n=1 Tax=Setomelanomma holmii TaxID=210430 RepID=A0A9P4LIF7_9PLEO|nr:hypothetical protein EK21DRAFT_93548 [Setomelanomma holmii]
MVFVTGLSDPKHHPDNANLPTLNSAATIIGVTISVLSLAVVCIALRLWVRLRDGLWGWDDAFVLLSGIASIVGDGMVCLMPRDGMGLHFWTLDYAHLLSYFRHIYSTNICYSASACFIKLAILFQYLRLFAEYESSMPANRYRLARRTVLSLITLSSVWGLTFFLLAIFPCSPIAKNWNPFMKGTCFGWGSKEPKEFFAMFASHAASNTFLDILVLLAPVPFLGRLQLAGKSRAGLITLFTLGCIVVSVAIGRMISLTINRAGTIPVLDMSYHTPSIYIFSVLEVNIAIIAASIPIFWPVIATFASNKIWVVNEIEVRVENASRDSFSTSGEIGLVEQGSWGKEDLKEDFGGRTSRLSELAKTYDRADSRTHRHKQSNTSSLGRSLGINIGTRPSQESQRSLCHNPYVGLRSDGTISRGEREDWFVEVDRQNTAGKTTTTVETTDIPFTHIKALER